jgi:hypothetical protein
MVGIFLFLLAAFKEYFCDPTHPFCYCTGVDPCPEKGPSGWYVYPNVADLLQKRARVRSRRGRDCAQARSGRSVLHRT